MAKKAQRTATKRRPLKWLFAAVLVLALVILSGSGQRVLVLGIDQRPGDIGRSDTMMLVSPRPFHGGLKLLSIPRDTRVEVPGFRLDRINTAYPVGGPPRSVETVELLLDLPVHHYFVVTFDAVEEVVDALGGVTVQVEDRMVYRDQLDLDPGEQRLDGAEALVYIRYRDDPDADIGRVARQRQFFAALLREAIHPRSWPRLPEVYRSLREHTDTSLSKPGLIRFGAAVVLSMALGIEGETVPGQPAFIGGASYWIHDPDGTAETVAQLFGR